MSLTLKQSKFLEEYFKNKGSITKACERAGVAKTTFYSWLKNRGFKSKFEELKESFEREIFDRIYSLTEKAFDTLEECLKSENSYVKLRAVALILEAYYKLKERELEERIERLEDRVNYHMGERRK